MNYRKLGNTGLVVSEIGFGAWGIGGVSEGATSYGPTNDKTSKEALRTALLHGITFFDTSNIYGDGHSEELIGEAFKDTRKGVVIASKIGFTKHGGPHDLSPDYMRSCLEGSLRRLQTDYIDLYQLHSPPIEQVRWATIDALEGFKREGKIRAYGLSAKTPEHAVPALRLFNFKAIKVNFSMLDQRAIDRNLFALASSHETGIIARTPFNFGFLTGKIRDIDFGPQDHRSTWPKVQLEQWKRAAESFSSLNEGKGRALAELALQFCLYPESVSTVIPGMLTPEEVKENAKASELPRLGPRDYSMIRDLYAKHHFFIGASAGA